MLNLIKPGHVLDFGTCPSTIRSPAAGNVNNDNTAETPWPGVASLNLVQCLSHPSGPIGDVAARVANEQRSGFSPSRMLSYSSVGRGRTPADRPIGSANCSFVGYTDGKSYFIATNQTVFSKDFSGCLMVAYRMGGQRRVAHVAASQVANMDCKQAFLNTLQRNNATLLGWFRPYVDNRDGPATMQRMRAYMPLFNNNMGLYTTFGVITATGEAYSLQAFKPTGFPNPDKWVVTSIVQRPMSQDFIFNAQA